jgi:hypothetical protein
MQGRDPKSTVTVFVVVDVEADEAVTERAPLLDLDAPEASETADARSRQRARQIAFDWLRASLPRIMPRDAAVSILGPAECGPELLGIHTRPSGPQSRIVVTTVALRDGRTCPRDAAPSWLTDGLSLAQTQGKRLLGFSRAGTFYGRFEPLA